MNLSRSKECKGILKKQSCKSRIIICQFWGIVVGDGIPGCNAPTGFTDALTFLRSVRRCHLLDVFFITKIGEFQGEQDSSICFNSSCISISSFSSVQSSRSVVSNSLWPHESQDTRPPCPSPNPWVYPNSCPLSQWCHPTISSSVVPFSCPQSFPASGSFQMSRFFASGGQSIGVSALASVLPMNTQDWSI